MGAYDCDCINNLEYDRRERKQKEQSRSTASTAQSTNLIDRQQAIDALDCINGVEEVLRSLPTIQPEPTDEQVAEYCKRRCLHVVTDDFFHTVQPEPHEGEWVQIQRCTGDAQPDLECPFCKHRIGWFDMGRYCAGCGAKLKGGAE